MTGVSRSEQNEVFLFSTGTTEQKSLIGDISASVCPRCGTQVPRRTQKRPKMLPVRDMSPAEAAKTREKVASEQLVLAQQGFGLEKYVRTAGFYTFFGQNDGKMCRTNRFAHFSYWIPSLRPE